MIHKIVRIENEERKTAGVCTKHLYGEKPLGAPELFERFSAYQKKDFSEYPISLTCIYCD